MAEDGAKIKWTSTSIYESYKRTWWTELMALEVRRIEHIFQARSDDVILASFPKSGTTWLKSIMLELMYGADDPSILDRAEPHLQAPCVEYTDGRTSCIDLVDQLPSPRFYQTHMPFHVLPPSIVASRCRIVYIARNPKDVIVSMSKFYARIAESGAADWGNTNSLEDMVGNLCRGQLFTGPFHQHVLGYWRASLCTETPVLFLFYEELWKKPAETIQAVGEWIGRPVDSARAREIADRCSFDRLRSLKVNSETSDKFGFDNRIFFHRGGVGHWREQLMDESSSEIDAYIEEHFRDSGLEFVYE